MKMKRVAVCEAKTGLGELEMVCLLDSDLGKQRALVQFRSQSEVRLAIRDSEGGEMLKPLYLVNTPSGEAGPEKIFFFFATLCKRTFSFQGFKMSESQPPALEKTRERLRRGKGGGKPD